jgi:hypothetical protein
LSIAADSRLLSSVLNQLVHLSVKLDIHAFSCDPYIVSGDSIQELCFDRLQSSATYTLDLSIETLDDWEEKIVFKSFLKASFVSRCRSRVIIQENSDSSWDLNLNNGIHYILKFVVFTLSYNDTSLTPLRLSKNAEMYELNISIG